MSLKLEYIERDVSSRIRGVALRERQQLPQTVAERLRDYRAQNVADWVMYRTVLAGAAEARDLACPLVPRENGARGGPRRVAGRRS